MIKINTSSNQNYTIIPNWFIDHYLASANGDFVKVYLVLLRYISNRHLEFDCSEVADLLHLTESDIVRALKFWTSKDLLMLEFKNKTISAITMNEVQTPMDTVKNETIMQIEVPEPQIETPNEPEAKPKVHVNLSTKPSYSMDELSQFVAENKYKDLVYVTGRYLGKNLSQYDLSTLISFHDWLGLPVEVIEWLIEYCASNEHRNMRYIEKVAMEWADRGINTLKKAKLHTETFSKKYFVIKKALGFANRTPVPYEIKIMDKWLEDYRFDIEIILEACNRTMKQAPSGSFSYTDKILEEWFKSKVLTLNDITKLDEMHAAKTAQPKKENNNTKNKFVNYDQRDYDFENLEKKAFERLLKETNEGEYIS